jgi:ABC-2 type transport system permease protein
VRFVSGFSAERVFGLLERQLFLYRRSMIRMLEVVYWPVMDLLVWGFVSVYVGRVRGGGAQAVAFFIGGMILWDLFFRAQQAISVSFLEDIWTRNLINVFVSPISTGEFIAAMLLLGVMKVIVTAALLSGLAYALYAFNLFQYGLALVPFVANLLLSAWGIGIITIAMILRWGQGAETLAWAIPFLFTPFSAVFYPVSVLPAALRPIAWALPPTHSFEGMRAVLSGGTFPWDRVGWGLAENAVLLAASAMIFSWVMYIARDRGLLLRIEG